ncbi:50S ribosomal protein L16 [Candidatus Woesearchaeota archaeon]|nr:50S ribosomal protein L16 [Candidatus Woesearchaeota archaeon]
MAKLRKFVAYRRVERPYTRISKFRKHNFVRARPNSKIVRFNMGDVKKDFTHTFNVVSKQDIQIRHNAIESARQSCNRILEKNAGKMGYFLRIRMYPHHILRENPLAAGAGADRMSTGMKKSFGKPIGIAARIKKGQTLFEIKVNKQHLAFAKRAANRVRQKFPGQCAIVLEEKKQAQPNL